jgi:hypothetical protein
MNEDQDFARNRQQTFEKLVAVQGHVNGLRKMKGHILSQRNSNAFQYTAKCY